MSDDRIAKALHDRSDEMMRQALYGTSATVTNSSAAEPQTIDTLRKMMLKMPPAETWLSSRLFPSDAAFCVSGSGENFTCAHPSFWTRAIDVLRRSDKVEARPYVGNPLGMNLTPIEIDPWDGDSEDAAKWRAEHWDRLRAAVEVALIPLPEWLRSPPKFSKHG